VKTSGGGAAEAMAGAPAATRRPRPRTRQRAGCHLRARARPWPPAPAPAPAVIRGGCKLLLSSGNAASRHRPGSPRRAWSPVLRMPAAPGSARRPGTGTPGGRHP